MDQFLDSWHSYRFRYCSVNNLGLFIVVESIEDAYRLAKGCAGIRSINLGGCKPKEDIVKTIYKTIPVTARDEEMLKELLNDGIEIEIRQVPGEQKVKVSENM